MTEDQLRKLINKYKAPFLPWEDKEYAFIRAILRLHKLDIKKLTIIGNKAKNRS